MGGPKKATGRWGGQFFKKELNSWILLNLFFWGDVLRLFGLHVGTLIHYVSSWDLWHFTQSWRQRRLLVTRPKSHMDRSWRPLRGRAKRCPALCTECPWQAMVSSNPLNGVKSCGDNLSCQPICDVCSLPIGQSLLGKWSTEKSTGVSRTMALQLQMPVLCEQATLVWIKMHAHP